VRCKVFYGDERNYLYGKTIEETLSDKETRTTEIISTRSRGRFAGM